MWVGGRGGGWLELELDLEPEITHGSMLELLTWAHSEWRCRRSGCWRQWPGPRHRCNGDGSCSGRAGGWQDDKQQIKSTVSMNISFLERCEEAGEGKREFVGGRVSDWDKVTNSAAISVSCLFLHSSSAHYCLFSTFLRLDQMGCFHYLIVISTDELPCNVINLGADVRPSLLPLPRYQSEMTKAHMQMDNHPKV